MAYRQEMYLTPEEQRNYQIRQTFVKIGIYAFLVIVALFVIIPFYWMLATALRTDEELKQARVGFFPEKWQFRNFLSALEYSAGRYKAADGTIIRPVTEANIAVALGNTLLVGFATTALGMITTTLSAFAFARLNFRGKGLLFAAMLGTMMIPGEIFVLTNYSTISQLGWLDTYQALIFPFIISVFYIYFLRQTFKQIPDELYFAAKVDGTGDFKYLRRVMIPLAKSTLTTIFILSVMGTWNAYVWPSLVTRSGSKMLVSNALMDVFQAGGDSGLGLANTAHFQMAMATMITVPLLVAFLLLRKYIMSGVARGGTKG